MENILGFGLAGGVIVGVGLLVVRKPVLSLIDGFSNQLIPSEFTFEETEYLKAYSKTILDGEINERERSLLVTLATAFGIDEQRISYLEEKFDKDQTINEIELST